MDELVQKVAERAGINAEQAQQAIEAIMEHLQGGLPEGLVEQLGGLLGGQGDGGELADRLKGMTGGLGGLLGR